MQSPAMDAKTWNHVIASKPHTPFLQAFEWGEFQQKSGNGVYRFPFYESGKIVGAVQFFAHRFPQKRAYLYMPQGPVGKYGAESVRQFQGYAQEVQKKERAIFFKLESREAVKEFFSCEKQKEGRPLQPSTTLIIDLGKPESSLLARMHPKTRYNIRLAHKHGVQIRKEDMPSKSMQDAFVSLLKQTAKRDSFFLHPDFYYRTLIEFFAEKKGAVDQTAPFVRLYTAFFGKELLAGAIVIFFGDTATYLHGASSTLHRNVMAPTALHWHIIRDAKSLGYRWYDFWGIADSDKATDPWAGITRFKKGFGGEVVHYPPAIDCIFSPFFYTLYSSVRILNKAIKYWRVHVP